MPRRCLILLPILLLLLFGCAGKPAAGGEEALFSQELLFLQQGFRQHGVEGTYTVYFVSPEAYPQGLFAQDLLIEGDAGLWWERLTYTYDPARDWYAFTGSFEPVLLPGPARLKYAEAEREAKEAFRSAATVRAELSADLDLPIPLRFDVPPGPVTYRQRREEGSREGGIETWIYFYQDLRLDFTAQITYPQFAVDALPRAEELNRRLEEAAFYSYRYNSEGILDPAELLYGEVQRACEITRWDGRYLSLCLSEYNSFRLATHPNQWYTGLTLDTETGQRLTLSDVLGPDWNSGDAIARGAFHPLPPWDLDSEATAGILCAAVERDVSDSFCLTDSTLILMDSTARCSFRIEAPLPAVGLERWLTLCGTDGQGGAE